MVGAGEWQALENGRRWRMVGAREWQALENVKQHMSPPPSTILPDNYRHLQHPQALNRPKQEREDSILRQLALASLGDL
jgi:hypothetical protein